MLWAGMIRKGHPQIPGHGLVARPERMGRPELHFLSSPLAFQTPGEQECGPSREMFWIGHMYELPTINLTSKIHTEVGRDEGQKGKETEPDRQS